MCCMTIKVSVIHPKNWFLQFLISRERKPICTIQLYLEDIGLHTNQMGNLVENGVK